MTFGIVRFKILNKNGGCGSRGNSFSEGSIGDFLEKEHKSQEEALI